MIKLKYLIFLLILLGCQEDDGYLHYRLYKVANNTSNNLAMSIWSKGLERIDTIYTTEYYRVQNKGFYGDINMATNLKEYEFEQLIDLVTLGDSLTIYNDINVVVKAKRKGKEGIYNMHNYKVQSDSLTYLFILSDK